MAKNKFKIPAAVLIIFILICLAGGLFFYLKLSSFATKPFKPDSPEKTITIPFGQGLNRIAKTLEKEEIISSQVYFKFYTKFKNFEKKIQAGEYLLSASKSPEQILEILTRGKVKLYKITFPEGLTLKETAGLLEKSGRCNGSAFESLCHDRSFIGSLGLKLPSLEGYLFPDTYFFPKQTTCETIIRTMLQHFNNTFTPKWNARADELGLSVHEVVTLASIIEKETGDASERPLISSVFHNRLRKNMRLESDPTVIYGIKNFDGNIKRKHLKMVTPYNTYQIKGLPAGPIANPGALSLSAALYPARSDYLFFVSRKDTTHQFSKTIQAHRKAVKKYQLKK